MLIETYFQLSPAISNDFVGKCLWWRGKTKKDEAVNSLEIMSLKLLEVCLAAYLNSLFILYLIVDVNKFTLASYLFLLVNKFFSNTVYICWANRWAAKNWFCRFPHPCKLGRLFPRAARAGSPPCPSTGAAPCSVTSCVYIMRLKTEQFMSNFVMIWWSICGHVMVCRSEI